MKFVKVSCLNLDAMKNTIFAVKTVNEVTNQEKKTLYLCLTESIEKQRMI